MNVDEDTYLSAYLDGELDAAQRARVEAALEAEPAVAERLRALASVRDAVAGLSRPGSPADVASLVLTRIEERPPLRLPGPLARLVWPDRPRPRLAPGLASAAALAAAAAAALLGPWAPARTGRDPRGGGAGVVQRPPVPTDPARPPLVAATPAAPPKLELEGFPKVKPGSKKAKPKAHADAAGSELALAPGPGDRQADLRAQQWRRMLDSPTLNRAFVVADVAGGQASEQIAKILETSPRKYARYVYLSVGPGQTVDPDHPGAASVYAVVMDDQELGLLRETLQARFPGRVEETTPRPETLTQLAELDGPGVSSGTAVADLIVPQAPRLSLRENTEKAPLEPVTGTLAGAERPGVRGAASPADEPDAGRGSPPGEVVTSVREVPAEPARPRPGNASEGSEPAPRAPAGLVRPTSVVLVWVSHPPAAPADRR